LRRAGGAREGRAPPGAKPKDNGRNTVTVPCAGAERQGQGRPGGREGDSRKERKKSPKGRNRRGGEEGKDHPNKQKEQVGAGGNTTTRNQGRATRGRKRVPGMRAPNVTTATAREAPAESSAQGSGKGAASGPKRCPGRTEARPRQAKSSKQSGLPEGEGKEN